MADVEPLPSCRHVNDAELMMRIVEAPKEGPHALEFQVAAVPPEFVVDRPYQ